MQLSHAVGNAHWQREQAQAVAQRLADCLEPPEQALEEGPLALRLQQPTARLEAQRLASEQETQGILR